MNILEEIAGRTRLRVAKAKERTPLGELREKAQAMGSDTGFPFEKALAGEGITFICEVKRASPSKGLIAPDFPYVEIAREYEDAGAGAVSVLTEPEYFMGSNAYLERIHKEVSIPILRKDFTVDEYMLYEAKVLGASAVLLICSLLEEGALRRYMEVADSLGMSALVEAHDEAEVQMALAAGARIIGVNNRDLKTFTVDIRNSIRLRKLVPENRLFISESGISTREDIAELERNHVDGVLVGETFMRSGNIRDTLSALRR